MIVSYSIVYIIEGIVSNIQKAGGSMKGLVWANIGLISIYHNMY